MLTLCKYPGGVVEYRAGFSGISIEVNHQQITWYPFSKEEDAIALYTRLCNALNTQL